DPDRGVAATVERARAQAAEVADSRQRDGHEPVEELVHAGAAQRDTRADRHALADLETRDRLAGATHLGTLPGDRGQLLDRAVQRLRLRLRLAHAHIERDLRDPGDLHDRGNVEVVLEARPQLALVEILEARAVGRGLLRSGGHQRSISWPQSARRQTRILTFSPLISLNVTPMR